MRGMFLLLGLSLKRARTLLLTTGLLLAAFQVLLVVIAGSFERSGEFEQLGSLLPPFVKSMLGPALASVMSFSGIACLGYFDLGIVIALLALVIAFATVPASEVESGFAELVLARPLQRHWIITRTIALLLLAIVFILAVLMAGTWAGLAMFAPKHAQWPTPSMVGWLALNLGLLMLCWGGVAMAFGAACRRTVASAVTGLLALATFLLQIIGSLWAPAERLSWLSPFFYFIPFELAMGRPLPVEDIIILWAISMTGFTLAYFFYSQRDISH